jgi:hypothetical protein
MGKLTKKGAEKKALKAMSDYVRERDRWQCISCNKVERDPRKMDCGHLFSRRFKSIKFNLLNVSAQCIYCNRYLSGNVHEYIKAFKEKHGEDEYEKLDALKNVLVKRDIDEFLALEKTFKQLLKELKEKNLW